MIDIYIADYDIAVNKKQMCLSEYRSKKLLTYKNESDKLLSLTASYLIDEGLKKYGLRECDMVYRFGEHGKPYFAEHEEIYFNLSHSGRYVTCVFSDKPIGVDIQCKNRARLHIAQRLFTEKEHKYILESSNPDDMFIRLWTFKESYLKLIGTGLSQNLKSFEVNFYDSFEACVYNENKKYKFYEIDNEAYHLALCYCENENSGDVSVHYLT